MATRRKAPAKKKATTGRRTKRMADEQTQTQLEQTDPAELARNADINRQAMVYINYLSTAMGTDINGWDIPKIFADAAVTGRLIVDKNELNKRFYQYREALINEPSRDNQAEVEKAMEEVAKTCTSLIHNEQKQIEEAIKLQEANVKDLVAQIDQTQTYIQQLRVKTFIKYQGSPEEERRKEELRKIVQEGVWVDPMVRDGHLYLHTANDIHVEYATGTYPHYDKKVRKQVNIGKYGVKIDLTNFRISLLAHENNLVSKGNYIHPHGTSDGYFCWGDSGYTVEKLRTKFELHKALSILHSILVNYTTHGSYIEILRGMDEGQKHPNYKSLANNKLLHPRKAQEILKQ